MIEKERLVAHQSFFRLLRGAEYICYYLTIVWKSMQN